MHIIASRRITIERVSRTAFAAVALDGQDENDITLLLLLQ